ncbi:MAG: EF-hand domain-containing protein [Sphingomonadales bacterium]
MANKVLITALVAGMALTTGAVAGIGTALAGDKDGKEGWHGRHHGRMIEKLDTDKDGTVSKEEFEAKRAADFAAADADKDGNVSQVELIAFHEKKQAERKAERQKRMYERLDANSDGKVTKDEFQSGGMFDRMDKDDDGTVSADEMKGRGKHRHHGHHGKPAGDKPEAPATD